MFRSFHESVSFLRIYIFDYNIVLLNTPYTTAQFMNRQTYYFINICYD